MPPKSRSRSRSPTEDKNGPSRQNRVKYFSHFFLKKHSFMRMREHGKYASDYEYKDFMNWNQHCIRSLTKEELKFTKALCIRISERKINLMDEENSSVATAENIFFDENRNLVITNPR